jgi:hypothetical protein
VKTISENLQVFAWRTGGNLSTEMNRNSYASADSLWQTRASRHSIAPASCRRPRRVIASIPEYPVMYMVQNPDRVGLKDKLTIPAAVWRELRWK